MTRRIKLEVDRGLCTSNGLCEHLAGQVFKLDEYRLAYTVTAELNEAPDIWEAVESCPVAAISVTDVASGEELYP